MSSGVGKKRVLLSELALIIIISFLVIAPSLFVMLGKVDNTVFGENRKMASFPSFFNIDDIDNWPSAFEKYYNDHLAHRRPLVKLNNWIKSHLFKTAHSKKVLVGENGWLFHKLPDMVLQHQGIQNYKRYHVRRIRMALEERRDWLREKNIDFLVIVVPDKLSVYQEYAPRWLPHKKGLLVREMLQEELSRSTLPLSYLDLSKHLIRAKEKEEALLYYRRDTHWNHYGAFIGYQKIANTFPKFFKSFKEENVASVPIERVNNLATMNGLKEVVTTQRPFPDKLSKLNSTTYMESPSQFKKFPSILKLAEKAGYELISNNSGSKKTMFFIADSFATWNKEYLASSYKNTFIVNTWSQSWSRMEQFPIDAINTIKPDLVLMQFSESRLGVKRISPFIVPPYGGANPPQVRQARLRRLYKSTRDTASATVKKVSGADGKSFNLELNKPTAKMVIARFEVMAHKATTLSVQSNFRKKEKWSDLCYKYDEMTIIHIKPGRHTVYLCGQIKENISHLTFATTEPQDLTIVKVDVRPHLDP